MHAGKAQAGRRLGEEPLSAEGTTTRLTETEAPSDEAQQCSVDLRELLVDPPARPARPLHVEQALAKREKSKLDALLEGAHGTPARGACASKAWTNPPGAFPRNPPQDLRKA